MYIHNKHLQGLMMGSCEHGTEPSDSIKGR